MYMPSPEMSRIMVMNDEDVFLEIVNTLILTLALKHHIYEEPEKEILMICFKSFHKRKRKPRCYESFREKLGREMNDSFESVDDGDKFLWEFGKMWDEWCYAWRYLGK